MGHYASEMVCRACSSICCKCPPKKTDSSMWINDIDEHFTPILIRDFDQKHAVKTTKSGPVPQSPLLLRLHRQAFETREGAEVNSLILLHEQVAVLEKRAAETAAKMKRVKAAIKKLTKETR